MVADSIDLMFRALAERTRLRIVNILTLGEFCVGDLVDVLRCPQPAVSRHLRYLQRAGLVRFRKSGHWSFYSLEQARRGPHRTLLGCVDACREESPELRADIDAARNLLQRGGCCPGEVRATADGDACGGGGCGPEC